MPDFRQSGHRQFFLYHDITNQSHVIWLRLQNQSTPETVSFFLLLKVPPQLSTYARTRKFHTYLGMIVLWRLYFALRYVIYLLREMRNEIKQTLRSERVTFWLTWIISFKDFYCNILKFSSSFLNMIEAWTYSILKCRSGWIRDGLIFTAIYQPTKDPSRALKPSTFFTKNQPTQLNTGKTRSREM